jgi:hypothetical protein
VLLQEKEAEVSALEERLRQQQLLRETTDREGRAAMEALTSECERYVRITYVCIYMYICIIYMCIYVYTYI